MAQPQVSTLYRNFVLYFPSPLCMGDGTSMIAMANVIVEVLIFMSYIELYAFIESVYINSDFSCVLSPCKQCNTHTEKSN